MFSLKINLLITLSLLLTYIPASNAELHAIKVKVTGLNKELTKDIKAMLPLNQHKKKRDLPDHRVKLLHRRTANDIKKALQAYGYYSSEVRAELTFDNKTWHAKYAIQPGQPIRVKTISITISGEGQQHPELIKLVDKFPLKNNDIFHHGKYEKGKRVLLRKALTIGFLKARFEEHSVKVYPETYEAIINITIDTDKQYYFSNINFNDTVVNKDYLRRYARFKPGDIYTTTQLFNFQNALNDSDLFSRVEVRADQAAAVDQRVPIEVTTEAQKKHRYTFGIGYGTDTGARGSLGWVNRRINLRGHRFQSKLKLSEIKSDFSSQYIIPIKNPRTDTAQLFFSWANDKSVPNTETETVIYGVNRTIQRYPGWLETIYLNYQTDSYVSGTQSEESNLLIPGITWQRLQSQQKGFSRKGLRLSLDIKGAHPELGSDAHFLQAASSVTLIQAGGKSSRFILRGDIASTRFGSLTTLPPTLRFYAGGDNSVRGYAYNSLSPNNEGGEQFIAGSMEYEHMLWNKWSGALFYDAGNAFNSWPPKLFDGVGLGTRWHTPVGPIRIDIAKGLDPSAKPWRLHLSFGHAL